MKKKLISTIIAIVAGALLLPIALGVGAMEVYGILSGSSFSSYITFYNVKTTGIIVEKQVENADEDYPADPNTEFEFELKINGKAVANRSYILKYKDENGADISEDKKTDANGKFKLKDAQKATFMGFKADDECIVTETTQTGFMQTDPVDDAGEAIPYTVKLTKEPSTVIFKNLYTHEENPILSVKKVDNNGEMLKGATLQLIQKNKDNTEKVIAEWVSDKSSKPLQIPAGSYILRELKAPTGYEVSEDMAVELKDTEEVQEVVMVDKPAKIVPTGLEFFRKPFGRVLALLIVLLAAFIAIYFGVIRRKKQS